MKRYYTHLFSEGRAIIAVLQEQRRERAWVRRLYQYAFYRLPLYHQSSLLFHSRRKPLLLGDSSLLSLIFGKRLDKYGILILGN
jgi:hypothetical protein